MDTIEDLLAAKSRRVIGTSAAASVRQATWLMNDHAIGSLLVLAGDRLEVELVRAGENPTQGVGYLSDGTMVVVEGGATRIGESVSTVVTNTLTTAAGRLIFARAEDAPADPGSVASMAARATQQPKHRDGASRGDDERSGSGRNPRRS